MTCSVVLFSSCKQKLLFYLRNSDVTECKVVAKSSMYVASVMEVEHLVLAKRAPLLLEQQEVSKIFNFFHEIPSGATSIVVTNNDVIHGSHVAITGTASGDLFRGSGTSPSSSTRVSLASFIILHEVGSSEVFRSTGPSTQPLRLEVYLNVVIQDTITYKYYLARGEITYFWDEDNWGPCSETCDGTEMRVVICRAVENGVTSAVTDSLCEMNVGTKPETVRSCNVGVCPSWNVGGFGSVRNFLSFHFIYNTLVLSDIVSFKTARNICVKSFGLR
ncbi:Papilin [Holothuria leucospilota]|uniref:Papilin n=1 Tax=Holothuria leucospilota TaxID=206669 RepID=A0A9Q0YE65_HOLLE|nr:Papilin [Holothuria leucospilota]